MSNILEKNKSKLIQLAEILTEKEVIFETDLKKIEEEVIAPDYTALESDL